MISILLNSSTSVIASASAAISRFPSNDSLLANRTESRGMQWFKTLVVSCLALLLCSCAFEPPLRRNAPPPGAGVTRAFADDLAQSLGAPMTEGNRIETLINGDQIFPAMLDAIRHATNSIMFENFIWRSGALSDY